ncbi:MAG: cell division protein ZapA [Candidatus Accumulibacter sp.]|jgi:cell division protein ZapA|nr:cell division protein ZapA [Accumulibacter sp.]
MPGKNDFLDITLLGKEYRVACPPEDREALLRTVAFLEGRMQDIAEKTRSGVTERIAVMAALNIAHEFLSLRDDPALTQPRDAGLDFAAVQRRIASMEAQIDAVMEPQDPSIR